MLDKVEFPFSLDLGTGTGRGNLIQSQTNPRIINLPMKKLSKFQASTPTASYQKLDKECFKGNNLLTLTCYSG